MKRVFFLFFCVLSAYCGYGANIEWVGSSSAVSNANTTLSLSKPSGTSSGDLILIQAGYTVTTGSITVPSGFTAYVNTGSDGLEYTLCYRVADGTEDTAFTLTSNAARNWMGSIAVYRNVNPGAPFQDLQESFSASANGETSFDAPSATASNGLGMLVVFAMSRHTGTPAGITAPSGMTSRGSAVEANRMIVQAELQLSASGATGAKTIDFTGPQGGGSANNRRHHAVSLILRPLIVLYSYQSGNFDSTTTWTTDPSVSILSPSGGIAPQTGDSIVIKNGRTITLSVDKSALSMGVLLEEGAVFDLQSFTFDGLTSISGQGRLRSSGTTGGVTYFPASSSSDFLGSSGGILEYYGGSSVTWNTGITTCHHLELKRETSDTTRYTLASNLTLSGNLTLSRTGSGVSIFIVGNNTTDRTLDISGNASVSAGCQWIVGAFNSDHLISVGGDLSNYGTVRFTNLSSPDYINTPTTGTATLTFTGASNNSFYCYGQTDLYNLTVNKGTDQTYILSVESNDSNNLKLFGHNDLTNNPDDDPEPVGRKALKLFAGTLKLNQNIYLPCLTTGGDDFTIPQSAALWVNGAHIISTTGTGNNVGIRILGKLRLSSGIVETGTSWGINYRANGVLQVEGGYLHAAQFRQGEPDEHYGAYIQSGGHVLIDGPTEDNSHARFSLPNNDCVFTMSGGLLEVKYPVSRSGSNINLVEINTAAQNYSVTGGEISLTSDRNAILARFLFSGALYQLNLHEGGGNAFTSHAALAVQNSLLLQSGDPVLDMANFDLSLEGNMEITSGSSLDMGTGTLSFNGSGRQEFTVDGSLTGDLSSLTIDKSDTLELLGSLSSFVVTGTFSLLDGVLNDGGKTLEVRGDAVVSSVHTGSGKLLFSTANTRIVSGNGNGVVNNLEYNASGDATTTLSCNIKITGNLEFVGTARRVLDMGAYSLVFDTFATVVNPAANRFVRFNGLTSSLGCTKVYSADSFYFPIGSGTGGTYDYTPAAVAFSSSPNEYGSVTVRPVASEHLAVTEAARSLTYYWKTSSSGFDLGSAEPRQYYFYLQGNVVTGSDVAEGTYVPASFDYGAGTWTLATPSDIDTVNNRMLFAGSSFPEIDGEYTAGDVAPLSPFGAVQIYYSRVNNGSWADVNTWTLDSNHTAVNTPAAAPTANSIVRIGNGTSVFHNIEVNANSATAGSITICQGSILDLNTYTGHNLGVVNGGNLGGTGKLRVDRNAATYVFPSGDFNSFLSAGGGEVEYYNSSASNGTLPSGVSSYNKLTLNAQSTGIINFPAQDLIISDSMKFISAAGSNVYLNPTNSTEGDITVEKSMVVSGGTVSIRNPGGNARYYHVKGDVKVDSAANLSVQAGGTGVVHTIEIEGNLINNGTLDVYNTGSRHIELVFSGDDTAWFTGTRGSAVTDINMLTVNKGSGVSGLLTFDVEGTLTTRTSDWLTLQSGTFRFSKASDTLVIWDDAQEFEIPAGCALSINNSTSTLNLAQDNDNASDLLLTGRLEILAGTLNVGVIGPNRNNDIIISPSGIPEIIITAGALNVNGQVRRSTSTTAGSLYYSQTGSSTVTLYGRSLDDTRGVLEVLNSGSYFRMSDNSLLTIASGGAASYPDLLLNPSSSLVDGGTIQFTPSSPVTANQSYTAAIYVPLNNLYVRHDQTRTATLDLSSTDIVLAGDLLIDTSATLQTNGYHVELNGSLTKVGTYTGGTSRLRFSGSGSQLIGDFSSQGIYELAVDSQATLTLSGAGTSVLVSSLLTINQGGLFQDSGHLVNLKGNISNYGEHRSISNTATNTLQFTGTASQLLYGDGIFGNLVVNNGYSVVLQGPASINRQLTLTNGYLDIGAYLLTLGTSATVNGSFGVSQHIRSNGVVGDAGVRRLCNSGANNLLFPLGLASKYMPATINITASNASGSVTVKLINAKHPSTRVPADSQLNAYWLVDTTGFNTLTVTHTYEYVDAAISGNESAYVGGRFVSPGWTPELGLAGAVTPSSNSIVLSNVGYIHGSYTAGAPNEFGPGNTYYSRKSYGNWNDLSMWSVTGHNGDSLTSVSELPDGAPMVVDAGDTVVITTNLKVAESLILSGVLDVGNSLSHNLGTVSGTGTLRIKATNGGQFLFPSGSFTGFCGSGGGSVVYYGATNGTLPTRSEYRNLTFEDGSTRSMANVNLTIHGDLTIKGGVLDNSGFGKTISLEGDWLNDAGSSGFSPGAGKVSMASSQAQTLDGVSRFYKLEFSGGGNKTLLDSVSVGNELLVNGGRVYLGNNNMVLDSTAVTSGSPSASAMVVQNGGGRIMKRYKLTSPSFTFPIGEETGTAEYSPVSLSFNSGTFSASAYISVMVTDGASPACAGGSHNISRYWTFSHTGISAFSATVTGFYKSADVNGTESLISGRMSRPSLSCLNGSAANTNGDYISFTGAALNIFTGGQAPVAQPSVPASLLFFSHIDAQSLTLKWTKGNGQSRLVLARTASAVNQTPTDFTAYTADTNYSGSPQDLGSGNFAVYAGTDSMFTLSGLSPATVYHFAVFEYNNQSSEIDYLTISPAIGSMKTLELEPTMIASDIVFDRIGHTSMRLAWTGGNGAGKIIVAREGLPVTTAPADRSLYSGDAVFGVGDEISSGQFVVYQGTEDSVTVFGLAQNTRYHFAAFEWNGTDSSTNYYTAQHRADSQHSYLLLELGVMLEGAFYNSAMIANNQANIPGSQPYSAAPYNFSEFNSIQNMPSDSLVDWVMIELRLAATPSAAIPSTIRGRAVGFIRPNGRVDDTLGAPGIVVKTDEPGDFYVVVHHRTHISVMSSSHLVEPDISHPYYGYNFADAVTKAYGSNAQIDLGGGKWGLYSGRAENNSTAQVIDENDRAEMWNDRNKTGYEQTDVNLDGVVDSEDRSKVWNNRNVSTQIPQ